MSKEQVKNLKTAVAWTAAVAILLILVFVIELQLLLSFVLAILVFVGVFFVLNPWTQAEERKIEQEKKAEELLEISRLNIEQLRNLARLIKKREVLQQVHQICDMSDTILDMLRDKPTIELSVVQKLHYIFGQVVKAVTEYINLITGRKRTSPDRLNTITQKVENEILGEVLTALKDFADDLSKEDIVHLEAKMRQLESSLSYGGFS